MPFIEADFADPEPPAQVVATAATSVPAGTEWPVVMSLQGNRLDD